jgi:hypothetical protein
VLDYNASLYKYFFTRLNNKEMKHIRTIALMTALVLISADSFGAGWYQRWRAQKQQRQMIETTSPVTQEPVGAPLDGGLLAILGAAGLAYFGARRKKKRAE